MPESLTNSSVKQLPVRDKPYEVRDSKLKGFLVRVQPSGRKTFYFAYRNAAGKKNRIKLGDSEHLTVAQARDLAKERAADVVHGKDVQADKTLERRVALERGQRTLATFLDNHYGPWVLTHRKSGEQTLQRIKHDFESLFETPMDEISIQKVERWRTGKLKAGTKAATLNRSTTALRAALSKAVEWEILQEQPLSKLKRLREDSQPIVRYLSDEESERLLAALEARDAEIRSARERGNNHREKRGYELLPSLEGARFGDRLTPMVLLSLKTGLRRGELFDLCVEDIDANASTISVRAGIAKSGKSRTIPLAASTKRILDDWLDQSGISAGRIFPGDDGGRLVSMKKSFAAVLESAGIENFRWHDMRHDFASRLVMRGAPLNTVRELCGHSDLSTTLRYAHLAPDHKSEVISLLG